MMFTAQITTPISLSRYRCCASNAMGRRHRMGRTLETSPVTLTICMVPLEPSASVAICPKSSKPLPTSTFELTHSGLFRLLWRWLGKCPIPAPRAIKTGLHNGQPTHSEPGRNSLPGDDSMKGQPRCTFQFEGGQDDQNNSSSANRNRNGC